MPVQGRGLTGGKAWWVSMQDFAEKLYKSKTWQRTRLAYLTHVGGLCEKCLKDGLYTPAVIVHHKVPLTPQNIDNPKVTLSFSNLEALCRACHWKEHHKEQPRYYINDDGTVVIA